MPSEFGCRVWWIGFRRTTPILKAMDMSNRFRDLMEPPSIEMVIENLALALNAMDDRDRSVCVAALHAWLDGHPISFEPADSVEH